MLRGACQNKLNEHEPTSVEPDISNQEIVESGETGKNPEEDREISGSKGMAKRTARAAPTGDVYEQGAAGTNK